MKKLLLLLTIIAITTNVDAQTVSLTKVIDNNMSKSVLFDNAQKWATTNEADLKKEIEILNDKTESVVVKILMTSTYSEKLTKYVIYKFKFSVKIDCKDNKYRYNISSPSVLIGTDNTVKYEHLPISELNRIKTELGAAVEIASREFQKILEWDLDRVVEIFEKNNSEKEKCISQLSNLEDNKKYRKEMKQIKYRIDNLNNENLVLTEIIKRWDAATIYICKNIEEIMNENSDF